MTTNWNKFKLLLWKNFLIQKRHKLQTFFEIVLPVIFALLLLIVRFMVDVDIHNEPKKYQTLPLNTLEKIRDADQFIYPKIIWEIAYSPRNLLLESLLSDAIDFLNASSFLQPVAHSDAESLQRSLRSHNSFVAIEFPDAFVDLEQLPKDFEYAIRFPAELRTKSPTTPVEWQNWFTQFKFPLFPEYGPRNAMDPDGGIPAGYWREGFLAVQAAVSDAVVKGWNKNGDQVPPVYAKRFPYPAYVADKLLSGLVFALPLIIVISLLSSVINITKQVCMEKELQLKEVMRIMGLPNWLHWIAWFIKSFVNLSITISLLTILLKLPVGSQQSAILTRTDWSTLWFFLFTFTLPSICFCFLVSVFFSRANVAAMVSGLIWLALYVPFTVVMSSANDLAITSKFLLCLSSNSALALGLQMIIKFEGVGSGLQWSNLYSAVSPDDQFTISYVCLSFIVNAVFYMLLTLYLEKWPMPWYRNVKNPRASLNFEVSTIFEESRPGIVIKNLRKVYPNGKVALNGLNMKLFQDQITVLLGHNGAGKSTTMSILTGITRPTSGTAIINGFDILRDIDGVRRSFGLCPQHNILFDDLTVREHLSFYTALKGLTQMQVETETMRYVHKLGLLSKIDCLARTLSGGQKRKLSVALALCGNNKIVLLDEPTAGMDPSARRDLWDLLIEEKEGRTILLSTHYMDEADVLGDRIAILSDGELEAMGTSFYLKKRYGAGYRLICVKGSGCNSGPVTELLRKHIQDLKVDTEVGAELTYVLEENHTDKFRGLFKDLENNVERLNLASFGVSLTTLEDVFMKVGSDTNEVTLLERTPSHQIIDHLGRCESTVVLDVEKVWHLTGWRLIFNQIKAMFLKKFAYTRRNPLLFIVVNVIGVFFVSIAILAANGLRSKSDLPMLEVELRSYENSETLLYIPEYMKSVPQVEGFMKEYQKIINESGIGHIFHRTPFPFEDSILNSSETQLDRMNSEYLIGASLELFGMIPYFTCWFNNQAYHTAPLSLNMVHNAILRQFCADCTITVYNKPLPYKAQSKKNVLYQGNSVGFQLAYNTGFAIAFIAGCFSLFYLKERSTKSKLLQMVSGVNLVIYWMVAFIWDFFMLMVVLGSYLGALALFQEGEWSTWNELKNLGLIFVCYFWGSLPFIYVFSFSCDSPTTGFIRITLIFLFTGNILYFLVSILAMPNLNLVEWSTYLSSYFVIFPQYAVPNIINGLDWVITPKAICADECSKIPGCTPDTLCKHINECCEFFDHYAWEWPGMLSHLTYMIGAGFVGWLILIVIESGVLRKIRCWSQGTVARPIATDSEVIDEKIRTMRIKDQELMKYNLVVKNLSKVYGSLTAVNDLCIAIDASECFGLLGLNGAGKTTTFKMLTGDLPIVHGDAWLQGTSVRDDRRKVYQMIGYCPQFDAVLEDLTGYENLRMYCLLRGVQAYQIDRVVERISNELNLRKHLKKQVKHYSGGNKRKLSAAISLVGNPAVIYLDEPTAGMDVAARRLLWNLICRTREEGTSIVLTSHSMEECEALCTRIAIMVNGEFMCLGSPQFLKSKFSNGFTLKVKLKRQGIERDIVRRFIAGNFHCAVLIEEHLDMQTYQIPTSNMRWSEMFGIMQKAKQTLNVEDYSLGQTSLEQVFLFFTKYQTNPQSGTKEE